MAIANNKDLTHVVRTTQQWQSSYDKYECIPEGVLCIEFTTSGQALAKIGNGRDIFSKLPYIGGADLTNYFTKEQTTECINDILKAKRYICIKGILNNKNQLPTNATCGDLYFVISDNQSSSNKYDEYVYSPNNTWEPLGSIPIDIDLSEYAKIQYVDEKIEQVNDRIDDIEQHGTHTHANKDILDQITAPYTEQEKDKLSILTNYDDTELRELISKSSHTHKNLDILEKITAAYTAEEKEKLSTLKPVDISTVEEKITALERLAHEHSNKRILDRTTASFTTEYERKMRWIRIYTGCTGMEEGIAGLVPAAQPGEEDYVLSGAGEWVPQTGGGSGGGTTYTFTGGTDGSFIVTPEGGSPQTVQVYSLRAATENTLGGIKVGDGLTIDQDGVLSAEPVTEYAYAAGEAINMRNVSGTLPAGYVEVDYIEGNGNCYTVIDYIPNRKTKIVGSAALIGTTNDPVLFGTRTGSNGQQFVFWFNRYDSTQAKVGFVYGTNTWSTSTDCNDGKLIPYVVGDQFTFLISLDDEFNINDTFVHNITENGAPANNLKLGIFALVDDSLGGIESDNQIFAGRMYEFKIYEDDVLVVNLVPAVNSTTASVGFYDTVNDKFYTSNRSTQFTYDPSTIHVSGKIIDVKYGDGLTVNQSNELEVSVGEGLQINQDGEIEVDKSSVYLPGEAIDISPNGTDLPTGYADVEYLEATGYQWSQLDYYAKHNSRVVADFLIQPSVSSTINTVIFGSGAGSNTQYVFWINESSSSNQVGGFVFGQNSWSTSTDANGGRTFVKNKNEHIILDCSVNGCYIDNTLLHGVTNTGTFVSSTKLGLLASANGEGIYGYNLAQCRVYSFKIYEGTTLVVDLRPAIRIVDGKPGFCDVINEDFYPSLTSTDYVYDPSTVVDYGDTYINVKYGDGLTVNASNELEVSVGNGLQVDQNGAVEIDPTIIPEVPAYEGGTAISIEEVEHGGVTFDAWDSGTGWENVCYQDSTGNSVVVWQYEAHSPISNSYTLPAGATHIRAISRDQNDTMLWTSFSWIDSNNYHFASTTPDVFDDWFEIPTGAVKVNFGVRHSKLDTSTAMNLNDIKSVDITVQTISEIEIDVWNSGTGWLNGNYYSGTSDTFTTSWYYSYHSNPDAYIPIPEGATHVMVMGISNENDSHFEGGGVNVFSSESHSNHIAWWGCAWEWHEISSDAKFVQIDVKWNNNNTRTISGSDIKSVTLVWKLPALETNQAINVKYGDGLTVNQNNELEVNVGAGLQVNQTTNELEPKLGDGLELDEYNAITVDPFYPNTLILNCVLDDEPFPDLILHFTLDPDE